MHFIYTLNTFSYDKKIFGKIKLNNNKTKSFTDAVLTRGTHCLENYYAFNTFGVNQVTCRLALFYLFLQYCMYIFHQYM